MTMPGSCSSGFRSRPSAGDGKHALERVRRRQHEQQEAGADEPHHADHARDHLVGQVPASSDTASVQQDEHEHPQHHRAFVRAPRGGELVLDRQLRVRIGGDVQHREIAGDERVREAANHAAAMNRNWPRATGRASAIHAGMRRAAPTIGSVPCDERQQEREDQCEVSKLGDHGVASGSLLQRSRSVLGHRGGARLVRPHPPRRAACSSRRAWRAPRSRETTRRVSIFPCATTPFALLEEVGQDPLVDRRGPSSRYR